MLLVSAGVEKLDPEPTLFWELSNQAIEVAPGQLACRFALWPEAIVAPAAEQTGPAGGGEVVPQVMMPFDMDGFGHVLSNCSTNCPAEAVGALPNSANPSAKGKTDGRNCEREMILLIENSPGCCQRATHPIGRASVTA